MIEMTDFIPPPLPPDLYKSFVLFSSDCDVEGQRLRTADGTLCTAVGYATPAQRRYVTERIVTLDFAWFRICRCIDQNLTDWRGDGLLGDPALAIQPQRRRAWHPGISYCERSRMRRALGVGWTNNAAVHQTMYGWRNVLGDLTALL